jgi:hypothetical protein
VEVSRLEELKSSKMKELVLKKRTELEEICRKTHLVPETDGAIEYAVEAIESGNILSILISKVFLETDCNYFLCTHQRLVVPWCRSRGPCLCARTV